MKRILFLSAVFLFLSFLTTSNVHAQGVFYCEIDGGKCKVDKMMGDKSCDPGFQSVPQKCEDLNVMNCSGVNFPCESSYEEECYECDANQAKCLPTQPDKYGGSENCPYTDYNLCVNECIKSTQETRYRCDDNQGCIKAQNGEYEDWNKCYDQCGFYGTPDNSNDDPKKSKIFCDDSGKPTNDSSSGKLYTAIGCIPLNETDFITFIIQWAIGIGGGMAFLLIILASFQIMTSQGDPKRLEAGKELLSSAIMGLILLIFSVTILRFIGVDIFHIKGF